VVAADTLDTLTIVLKKRGNCSFPHQLQTAAAGLLNRCTDGIRVYLTASYRDSVLLFVGLWLQLDVAALPILAT